MSIPSSTRENMKLSVVVVVFNMSREAPRTLRSLSVPYQRGISADDYEVLVIDSGSNPPFDASEIAELTGNFRLIRLDEPTDSPVTAVNLGLAQARGDLVCVMIDGARIATPGLLAAAIRADCSYPGAVISPLGWYLGFDMQAELLSRGHGTDDEDALLARIDWPSEGYRLFEVGVLDESNQHWQTRRQVTESNALFLRRAAWEDLGGMDERFASTAGGLVNLDTFTRAVEASEGRVILLLGEGTFHQIHGGFATNAVHDQRRRRMRAMYREYALIRGTSYVPPTIEPICIGSIPRVGAEVLHTASRLREERDLLARKVANMQASYIYRLAKPIRVASAWIRSLSGQNGLSEPTRAQSRTLQ
jgi:glycosyltransferase involved in cell wall biosynthesis